jgi:CheY-like chemotaxis protein
VISISEILKLEGNDVEYSTSSQKALEMIEQTEYDVVLLDVNMPLISGIELLGMIQNASTNEPKCIMVTGYSDSDILNAALNAGAYSYLVKPFEFEALEELLQIIAS